MTDGALPPGLADRVGTVDLDALKETVSPATSCFRVTPGGTTLVGHGTSPLIRGRTRLHWSSPSRTSSMSFSSQANATFRIAPQGTGHGASSLAVLDGTILVKTTRLRGVEIDAGAARAHIQAGALWEDVVVPAAEQGFMVLHGFVSRRRRSRVHARRRNGLAGAEPGSPPTVSPV